MVERERERDVRGMRERDKFACSLFKEAWISNLVVSTLYGVSES